MSADGQWRSERGLNYPRLLFLFSLFVLWLAAEIGASMRKRRRLNDEECEDFGIVQAAILTLLALLIGFSYSMAISRYDQRKNYEEAEANAIGTEYVRADLLPAKSRSPPVGSTPCAVHRVFLDCGH